MNEDPTVSFPVRMPAKLLERIKAACKLTGLSQQELIRIAMSVGLEDLQRCNYDISSAIVDAAHAAKKPALPPAQAMDPTANTAGSSSPTTGKRLKYATKTAQPPANVVPLPRPTIAPPSLPSDVAAEEAPPYGSKKKGGA